MCTVQKNGWLDVAGEVQFIFRGKQLEGFFREGIAFGRLRPDIKQTDPWIPDIEELLGHSAPKPRIFHKVLRFRRDICA